MALTHSTTLTPPSCPQHRWTREFVLFSVLLCLVVWVALSASTAFTEWRREWIFIGISAAAALIVIAVLVRAFASRGEQSRTPLAARVFDLTGAAEARRRSESRFRDWAEISFEWFWEQNAELRYTWFSDKVSRPGLTFNLIGLTRWEMVTEGVTEEQWAVHKAQLAAREPFRDFRYIRTGENGEAHHISVSGKPIFDENGEFCGYRGAGREITAEVRAAEALLRATAEAEPARAEAERLRQLAEETSRQLLEAQRMGKIGHWISDEVHQIVTWSPQTYEIAGLPPGSDIPMNIPRKVVHPDDLPEFLKTRARVIETRTASMVEQRWIRPDGEIRWVHLEINPRFDSSGRCVGLFGTSQDITARKSSEDALKRAQQQLADAIESISEGFVLFDADDRYVMTNSNYRHLFPEIADLFVAGTTFETVLRANVDRGIQDVGDEGGEAWIRKMLEWHRACDEPREQRFTNGRWVRIVERRTRDGGIVGIRTDITRIKTAEEALLRKVADLEAAQVRLERLSRDLTAMADDLSAARDAAEERTVELSRSEARFRDFALTSSHWLWETDTQHRFAYVSEGVRAFGFSADSLIGHTLLEIAADAGSDTTKWQAHHASLERQEPFRDFIYTWKNGAGEEGVASVNGDPFFDAEGCFLGYRGTGRDITRQVLAENALREAKLTAEGASLAKSQFLANMSHELRTPLNAIIGFSEMMELAVMGPISPDYKEYASLIHQSGEHLHEVINDILDLAKIDAGKFELREEATVDPRSIVEACVSLVRGHAEVGQLRLSTKIEDRLPLIVADPTRLKQILLNLLSNAIKFTEPRGSVAVTARHTEDGRMAFEVRDTGLGMTASEIEIALEPFGQIDPGYTSTHRGTGLGLPLARRLAELHGGSLRIESEKGRGTTVTVTLPVPTASGESSAINCCAMLDDVAG